MVETAGQDVSWEADIEELRRREALARQMGGAEKVKRQHDAGRLTVRERIDALLDQDSFHEIGAIAGRGRYGDNGELEALQPANFVFGRGRIDGRPVVVGGDDFTVRGGAADAAIWQKQVMSEQMANELRLPLVRLVDGTGGGGSVKTIESDGYTYVPANPGWNCVVDNMGVVPVVALASGSVAGLGAARLASEPLLADGRGHLAHVHRRAAGGGARSARPSPRTSSAAATSTRAPARSTTWWRARRKPSRARGASSPICRRRCTSCRRAATRRDDRRTGAMRG